MQSVERKNITFVLRLTWLLCVIFAVTLRWSDDYVLTDKCFTWGQTLNEA